MWSHYAADNIKRLSLYCKNGTEHFSFFLFAGDETCRSSSWFQEQKRPNQIGHDGMHRGLWPRPRFWARKGRRWCSRTGNYSKVKLMTNDHPRVPKVVDVVDRWLLFRGTVKPKLATACLQRPPFWSPTLDLYNIYNCMIVEHKFDCTFKNLKLGTCD